MIAPVRNRGKEMENLTRINVPIDVQEDAAPLPVPHFDEEATLLSARPVVPLNHRINLGGMRNYLLTAAVLLTAALVGAIVALSIDRFQHGQPNRGEVAQPALASQPAVDTPAEPSPEETAVVTRETEPAVAPATKTQQTVSQRAAAPVAKAAPPPKTNIRFTESLVPRRSNHRQVEGESRPRRVNSQRRARSRDINRIREIFEGPNNFRVQGSSPTVREGFVKVH
ncbi:MAG: hypothetical protein QOE77_1313 [Blastocatellia bacterium]|jgi:hypothetical protein|nr:hypothetical protein [Blastocatellia bacterium]